MGAEGVELCRPGGGSSGLQLWRRATAAESVYAIGAGPPARSAAPLPVGTSDPTDPNPARIELDGSAYVLLRAFLKLPGGAATKTADFHIVGFHGDGKHRGISLGRFQVSTSASSAGLTFDPGNGAATTRWYECDGAAYVNGLAQLTTQIDGGGGVAQALVWMATLECSVLVPRIVAVDSGVDDVVLLGCTAGRPRGNSVTEL